MPYADPDEHRAYCAQWMWERRERWVKANGPCRDCGGSDRLRILGLGSGGCWSYTESKRKKILAGCIVLCLSCWAKRVGSGQRKHKVVSHGTIMGYKHYRCRCDECKRANRDCVARQRRSKETPMTDGNLAAALDALRSIWQNARTEGHAWFEQRAFRVLADNTAALDRRCFTDAEWALLTKVQSVSPERPR